MDGEKITTSLKCPHCGNKAPMERLAFYDQCREYQAENSLISWTAGYCYELHVCEECKKVNLRRYFYHDGRDPDDWDAQFLYPATDEIPRGVPDHIAKEYREALKVKSISPNAFAVMLGRVLEFVCLDRKASGKDLHAKLMDLKAKEEIPMSIVEISHSLRQLRNFGAHAGPNDLTIDETPILNDLCRAVLESVYTTSQLISDARERLEKLNKPN